MNRALHEVLKEGAVAAARNLLGWELYNTVDGQLVGGKIVEAEAYTQDDPASHTYRGRTARNDPMFRDAGLLYIYFTYGMHWCMNIVTGHEGHGEAVLLRALEPIAGIEIMQQHRGTTVTSNLCNGPAKLVQALAIDPRWTDKKIEATNLLIRPGTPPKRIEATPRVGITKGLEHLWRFTAHD